MSNVQMLTGYQMPISSYLDESRPGVLVSWARSGQTGVAKSEVQFSTHIDGTYTPLAIVNWPGDRYLHRAGHPSYYYRIVEKDVNDSVLFTSNPIVGDEYLVNMSVAYALRPYLEIPVHDQTPIFDRGRTSCRWPYRNWNVSPPPILKITASSNEGENDPYLILSEYEGITDTTDGTTDDYPNGLKYKLDYQGKAWFVDNDGEPVAIQEYDSITASYHVQLLATTDLNAALYQALQSINAQPGAPKYASIASTPAYYESGLVSGAIYYLIRQIILMLHQREIRFLLQDPDHDAYDVIASLKTTAEMYEKQWERELKSIPIARYPTMGAIVTPEYMMPGGRSRFFRYVWKGGT